MAKALALAWFLLLDAGVGSTALPDIQDRGFIDQCLREHNQARSSVSPPASNMLHMTWDEGLAVTARGWARRCRFEHNVYGNDPRRMHPNFSSVGENLWVGSPPSTFQVARALRRWVDENQDYDYQQNTCTDVCGHYTQVVWASSYKVGCAVQLCPTGVKNFLPQEGAIFVCNYGTAGNFIGRLPYRTGGAACSGCQGYCVDNLCRDEERDSEKSYSWTPDWDPVRSASTSVAEGSGYVVILVVRPVALVLTFIAAFAVHYFNPRVFCYE